MSGKLNCKSISGKPFKSVNLPLIRFYKCEFMSVKLVQEKIYVL